MIKKIFVCIKQETGTKINTELHTFLFLGFVGQVFMMMKIEENGIHHLSYWTIEQMNTGEIFVCLVLHKHG